MSEALLKAIIGLLPVSVLVAGSLALFFRGKSVSSFLQLVGASCLLVAILTHVCEALQLFPSMHWGHQRSAGHYVDFWSAAFGVTLFPLGYLFCALGRTNTHQT